MESKYTSTQTTLSIKLYRQLMFGAILLALAMALASMPNRFEGPSLLHISEGHGIAVSDAFALALFIWGMALALNILWQTRARLRQRLYGLLTDSRAEIFLFGLGFGVLLNKIFEGFPWGRLSIWTALGAAFSVMALLSARRRA